MWHQSGVPIRPTVGRLSNVHRHHLTQQLDASLVVARIVQGIAVSPVECLPSATIAEIFFLHERAYRLGIYTLLLLGGKNLVPLVSAAIVQSLGWRWVFK